MTMTRVGCPECKRSTAVTAIGNVAWHKQDGVTCPGSGVKMVDGFSTYRPTSKPKPIPLPAPEPEPNPLDWIADFYA